MADYPGEDDNTVVIVYEALIVVVAFYIALAILGVTIWIYEEIKRWMK